ncbi:MAG: RagB/SusD family nutrient uptake outer membrane protein [Saprospiraceae bacterium]
MKKIIALIGMVAALTFGSCVKELEIDPVQSIDATVALETAADLESALVGAYGIMHGGALYGTNLNLLPELLGSDNYCQWRGTFQSFRQVMNKAMTVDNAEASRTWIAGYRAINVANNVLANLGKVTDPDQKAAIEAEALFIRGIMHFELVRIYAKPWDPTGTNNGLGVPISKTAVANEEAASVKGARNTIADVYAQIIQDLRGAELALPDSRDGTDQYRATTYTAKAFLSRVYLQQGRHADALTMADAVIGSGNYTLNASIASTFTNKFTRETIFELYNNDQNNAGTSNDGLTTFYASLPGIGRSDVRMLAAFANLYEVDDERSSQLIYFGTGRRPGSRQTGKWTSFGQNIPVIRLSEMLLTRAECNFILGSAVGAEPLADVNAVRLRARATELGTIDLDDIINERSLELCFEGLRIHDLKRLKLSTGAYPYDDPLLVFPIPEREIRANSALVQNDGY